MNGIKSNHQEDPLPDHDFHSVWGCSYSARSTLHDPAIRKLWEQYLVSPVSVDRQYHVLLGSYTNLFADFFGGYYPISLHAHATDALLPTTIASLVLNTVATSPLILNSEELRPKANEEPEETGSRIRDFSLELLGWTEAHVQKPTFVAIEGIYGAGFGPLAHTSKEWEVQAIASGPPPIVVNLKTRPSFSEIDTQFAAAKAQGAIAVVFDMVSTEDGSVLSVEQYAQLKLAAQRNRLLIIVDETMTAIRCGAPFAFQRPEYNTNIKVKHSTNGVNGNSTNGANSTIPIQPDLVIFGKGLGISGVAIGFSGPITHAFTYIERADILQSILYWRALVSRPIRTPVLIEALGTLTTARKECWPARSETIGATIRGILHDLEPSTREPDAVRGLGAMIALDREIAMRLRVQSAIRRRSPWVRWLPKLDAGNTDRELLMQCVFGKESREQRNVLSVDAADMGTMPLWCFVCGIQATEEAWCRECFLGICGNEVCLDAFGHHTCIAA
ncbi:hypothetical protein EJ05DRAFT_478545 [Pseudovirgaria hyperparasitica]|uniref:PLP-dependent transferase n=1 Tax=Pseudovirgaria hyperparasitica TaxID=470096 RepID=A0A6A6W0A6_9PEZI|nr:uncharacterized protein EJ05DRAFT_478545 [Pseudovirgaria hyperparasitica]KAF2755569.1 hypothetical protein EJ05DRAFT_478545 [Pseudovirgaria hyperparasitica]